MQPVNKVKLHEILAEFMDDIQEWSSNVAGSPTQQELAELDNIYDEAIDKLDKEYFKMPV
jgi:hypothetical protein